MYSQQHVFLRAHTTLLCANWNSQSVRANVLKDIATAHELRRVKTENMAEVLFCHNRLVFLSQTDPVKSITHPSSLKLGKNPGSSSSSNSTVLPVYL